MILHMLNWINTNQDFNHWHFNCLGTESTEDSIGNGKNEKVWEFLAAAGAWAWLIPKTCRWSSPHSAWSHAAEHNLLSTRLWVHVAIVIWAGWKDWVWLQCWVRLSYLFIFLLKSSALLLLCFHAFLQWDTRFLPLFILFVVVCFTINLDFQN